MGATLAVNPRRRRKIRNLIAPIISDSSDRGSIDRVAEEYVIYRRWLNHLEYAWANWADRHEKWVRFDGEQHLVDALQKGKGVFLVSGHYYGLTR